MEPGKETERLVKIVHLDMALKTITVFCGSKLGNDPRLEEGAKGTDKPRVLAINALLHSLVALAATFSAMAFYC